MGLFLFLVITAGVEPALSGWKPDVLTVILRDQYTRFARYILHYFFQKCNPKAAAQTPLSLSKKLV